MLLWLLCDRLYSLRDDALTAAQEHFFYFQSEFTVFKCMYVYWRVFITVYPIKQLNLKRRFIIDYHVKYIPQPWYKTAEEFLAADIIKAADYKTPMMIPYVKDKIIWFKHRSVILHWFVKVWQNNWRFSCNTCLSCKTPRVRLPKTVYIDLSKGDQILRFRLFAREECDWKRNRGRNAT